MLVHSLWDQEDIYGAIAVYKAIEPKDTTNDKVFLVMGPWHHGQEIGDGSALGALKFDSDTALYFRREILRPFLDQYLKDGAPEGGRRAGHGVRDRHEHVAAAAVVAGRLRERLHGPADAALSWRRPRRSASTRRKPGDAAFDEYVSDPAKPVPFRARPIQPVGYDSGLTWPQWLVDDQREASGRPDVLAFTVRRADGAGEDQRPAGRNLVASTSGTDSDWVVKLIDVYPDEVAGQPAMGGYQLMVVGRHLPRPLPRELRDRRSRSRPDTAAVYRFALPTANHVFLPGHRIMVQVQSSWFPLYDRNPQTLRAEHLLGEAGGLSQGRPARLPRPRRPAATFIELPWSRYGRARRPHRSRAASAARPARLEHGFGQAQLARSPGGRSTDRPALVEARIFSAIPISTVRRRGTSHGGPRDHLEGAPELMAITGRLAGCRRRETGFTPRLPTITTL